MQADWGFYGRTTELEDIARIMNRGQWFFCSISGRRRIGKTSLIREFLQTHTEKNVFYVQIPDGDERGVVQAFQDVIEGFGFPTDRANVIQNFQTITDFIGRLMTEGGIVILDEFQYFHRKQLAPFQSFLQAEVDKLRETKSGGLIVLGSIHTEMTAILEDRNAPLFNRITDRVDIGHWDFATLFEMWAAHGISDPMHWLFQWSLFEGVPKFYRDCFDQGVMAAGPKHRQHTLRRLFFEGSSPLRDEADNWFLREFRGRSDTVLKLLARLGPCSHWTLMDEFSRAGTESAGQLAGYLKTLIEKYQMVARRQPMFSTKSSRNARYVITDNFLNSWLGGIAKNVVQARIQPLDNPLANADKALAGIEGHAFEKMIRQLTVECSRKGVGDFALTEMVEGYWNKADGSDIEIDIVAVNEDDRILRLGECKRTADQHDPARFDGHIQRFLRTKPQYQDWMIQKTLYSPIFPDEQRRALTAQGYVCLDLNDFQKALM